MSTVGLALVSFAEATFAGFVRAAEHRDILLGLDVLMSLCFPASHSAKKAAKACKHVSMPMRMQHADACMGVCRHTCIPTDIHRYIHTYLCTNKRTHTNTDTDTNTHTQRHTYIYMYMYMYICIYVYIYTHTQSVKAFQSDSQTKKHENKFRKHDQPMNRQILRPNGLPCILNRIIRHTYIHAC